MTLRSEVTCQNKIKVNDQEFRLYNLFTLTEEMEITLMRKLDEELVCEIIR